MEVTLTSSQDQSGITTKLWRNHPEQTTEQWLERSLITSDTQKNQIEHNQPWLVGSAVKTQVGCVGAHKQQYQRDNEVADWIPLRILESKP